MREGNTSALPSFISTFIQYLKEHARSKKLFRSPGISTSAAELKDLLENEKPLNIEKYDEYTVATVLKDFLRELPEPLFDFNEFLSIPDQEEDSLRQSLKTLLDKASQENRSLFKAILELLSVVARYQHENRMTKAMLAVVFLPVLAYPQLGSQKLNLEQISNGQRKFLFFLDNAEHFCST